MTPELDHRALPPPVAGPDAGHRRRPPCLRPARPVRRRTGPLVEPEWWSYGSSDDPYYPLSARHSGDDPPRARLGRRTTAAGEAPASSTPPLRSRPARSGVWDRLRPREDADSDDDETVAHPTSAAPPRQGPSRGSDSRPDGRTPRRTTTAPTRIR